MKKANKAKDFLEPNLAAARLFMCAIEWIQLLKIGITVKWRLQIWYCYGPDWKPNPGQVAKLHSRSFSSGPRDQPRTHSTDGCEEGEEKFYD